MILKKNEKNINKIPRYYFFRILTVTALIYLMLTLPFMGVLELNQFSKFALSSDTTGIKVSVSLSSRINDTLSGRETKDILINRLDSLHSAHLKSDEVSCVRDNLKSEKLHKIFMFISIVLLIIINIPFKIYFRKLRKKKEIPEKISNYCKKNAYKMPFINAMVLFFIPFVFLIIGMFEIRAIPGFETSEPLMDAKKFMKMSMSTKIKHLNFAI